MTEDPRQPRPPHNEPEIIPPGAPDPRGRARQDRVIFIEIGGGRAIPLHRPSLFSLILILGLVGLAIAAVVVLLIGTFLISLPVVAAVFVFVMLASLLGRPRRF